MLTGTPMTVLTGRLSAFFKTVENELSESLTKVASGKRVANPSDSISDYFHAENCKRSYTDYGKVRSDVAETSAMLDVASGIGEQVFEGLNEMLYLLKNYYNESNSDDDKLSIKAEFDSLATEISTAIENGYYDGKKLVSDTSVTGSLKSINLDPRDFSQMFSVNFNASQVADPLTLTLGIGTQDNETVAVEAELGKAGSYLASVSAYSRGIKAQYNLVNTKILNTQAAESSIVDADTAVVVARAAKQSICHQATANMMAQANMARSLIVNILQF